MAQVVMKSRKKFMDVYIGLLGFVNDSCVLWKFCLYRQAQYGSFLNIQNGSQNGFFLDILCSIDWWSHIDIKLNNLFWKKITMGDIRKKQLLLKIHLVSWKKIPKTYSQNITSCGIFA